MDFYFVLCSLIRILGFAEDRLFLRYEKKNNQYPTSVPNGTLVEVKRRFATSKLYRDVLDEIFICPVFICLPTFSCFFFADSEIISNFVPCISVQAHFYSLNIRDVKKNNSNDYYYRESKRLRAEVLQLAEALKGQPLKLVINNGITMEVEITKSDLKTIVSKASRDNKFNAIKNALARDIPSFLRKSNYLGWRTIMEGKHEECAYFAYFDREIGIHTILAMRKMKNGGPYKPYAIIDEHAYEATVSELKKGTPL